MKKGARATWAAGDFDAVAQTILSAGRGIVERLAPSAGQDVLDIAAGTGNAAIPAAEQGARVVASDLTPELFEAGRANAERAGVEIEWVEADAEALPFDDASFDFVLSTFGIMFAPRHPVAAAEAARVLRPGGRLGFCCWRPEGNIGAFFKTIGAHLPPPPEDVVPPPMWGVPGHVEKLFDGSGIELEFIEEEVTFDYGTPEEAFEFYAEHFGPLVMARAALDDDAWAALRADLIAMYERESEPVDDGIRLRGEYLTTVGTKRG